MRIGFPKLAVILMTWKASQVTWGGKRSYIHTHTCCWASHLEIQLGEGREGLRSIFFKTPQKSVISQVQEPLLRAPGSLWPGMLALSPAFPLPAWNSAVSWVILQLLSQHLTDLCPSVSPNILYSGHHCNKTQCLFLGIYFINLHVLLAF